MITEIQKSKKFRRLNPQSIEKAKTYTLRFAKANLETWQSIKSGKKKVETRAGTIKYLPIKKGDTLIMSCAGKKFKKEIKNVTHFKNLTSLFKKYSPNTIHPGIGGTKNMIVQYHSFPGYKEKIAEFGILAFELN